MLIFLNSIREQGAPRQDDAKSFDWFASDHHFGDGRLHLLYRNMFDSADQMGDYIVEQHNKLVAPNDRVLFVGDVAISDEAFKQYVPLLNGVKTIILGNHDQKLTREILSECCELVVEDDSGLWVDCANNLFYATHYPTQCLPNNWNITGHIHGAWRYRKNTINVGIDAHFLRPVSMQNILFLKQQCEEYTDQDVWVNPDFVDKSNAKNSEL